MTTKGNFFEVVKELRNHRNARAELVRCNPGKVPPFSKWGLADSVAMFFDLEDEDGETPEWIVNAAEQILAEASKCELCGQEGEVHSHKNHKWVCSACMPADRRNQA